MQRVVGFDCKVLLQNKTRLMFKFEVKCVLCVNKNRDKKATLPQTKKIYIFFNLCTYYRGVKHKQVLSPLVSPSMPIFSSSSPGVPFPLFYRPLLLTFLLLNPSPSSPPHCHAMRFCSLKNTTAVHSGSLRTVTETV